MGKRRPSNTKPKTSCYAGVVSRKSTQIALTYIALYGLSRNGHLYASFHIFAYLKKKHNLEMVYDLTEVDFYRAAFLREDWSCSIYGDGNLKEVLPMGMPHPLGGKSMTVRVFVDSDHNDDQVTRRSRARFIVFLSLPPIYWSSKKQGSCETSTYGSEMVAMKQACEFVRDIRYKIRVIGISVDEPSFMFGDN